MIMPDHYIKYLENKNSNFSFFLVKYTQRDMKIKIHKYVRSIYIFF